MVLIITRTPLQKTVWFIIAGMQWLDWFCQSNASCYWSLHEQLEWLMSSVMVLAAVILNALCIVSWTNGQHQIMFWGLKDALLHLYWSITFTMAKSNLDFLFLILTSGLYSVGNSLQSHSWWHLWIVDLHNDMPTSSIVFLTWMLFWNCISTIFLVYFGFKTSTLATKQ